MRGLEEYHMPGSVNYAVQLTPIQVTPELSALFDPSDPASLRCQAVLDGHAAGRIFTDHPDTPAWGVVQEAAFGSLYLGGNLQPALMDQLITELCIDGDVLVGLWQPDPRRSLLPSTPDYSGYTLEFTNRETDQALPGVPTGCELRHLDQSLGKQILGRNLLIHMYGSLQQALKWGYGLCLMRGDELLCETFAGPEANGVIEMGVETQPHHMQKGYATLTCAHLIHEIEQQGYQTYWNCDKNNLPSAALARKLGYRTEREYSLLAWFKHEPSQEVLQYH
jgi:RimJ/RimL family protein N-acetyltransferase